MYAFLLDGCQDGNLFILFVYLCNQHGVTPTMINSLPAKVAQTSVPDSLGQYFQGLTTVMMMSGVFPEAMKDAAHCEYGMTAAVLNYVCMTADVLNYVCMRADVLNYVCMTADILNYVCMTADIY